MCVQELQGLQDKQRWYQRNQLDMTKEQEDEYLTYYSEKILGIQVIKARLSMYVFRKESSQTSSLFKGSRNESSVLL